LNAVNDNIGTPVARGLNILLMIVMAFLLFGVITLLGVAVIMMTENGLRADLNKNRDCLSGRRLSGCGLCVCD